MRRHPLPWLAVCLAPVLLTSACLAQVSQRGAGTEPPDKSRERAIHVLNRLTFGPRPGDVDRVMRIGIDRWIDQQLRPESIADSIGLAALEGCRHWTAPVDSIAALMGSGLVTLEVAPRPSDTLRMAIMRFNVAAMPTVPVITRDSARRMTASRGQMFIDNGQLLACRLARVEASEQQLLEVLTDFWLNHFSISGTKIPSRGSIVEWDRAVIRPNALGRFRDLLGSVVRSPTMLTYLDNAVSGADPSHLTLAEVTRARTEGKLPAAGPRTTNGLNENYARELLELHTLGVDGGYTQGDVIDVARALTGWTHTIADPRTSLRIRLGATTGPAAQPLFRFDSTTHDADEKVVLGHRLAGERGIEDGEEVLDILARHPSTARFIARKLAVRLVSDTPPHALVERAAATFLRTDGDLRAVVREIVMSREFNDPSVYGAKVKTPLELVLSTRRALASPPDTAAEVIDLLIALDQPPFGKATPEGWPETAAPWLSVSAMRERFNLASRVSEGELPSIPVEAWPAWHQLVEQPFDVQLEQVIQTLLNGQASAGTRSALGAVRPVEDKNTPDQRRTSLRELIGLALGSPEFQRR